MAKSKTKLITASGQVQGLVEQGYGIDVDIKNLTFKDKGVKKLLSESLKDEFDETTSVRVEATNGAAMVTQSEKYVIKGDAETIVKVREAAENGLLGDAVKTQKVLNVPVADRQKAAKILQAAGISATILVELSIIPAEYRELQNSESASVDSVDAKNALKEVVDRKVSYRIKYEKI